MILRITAKCSDMFYAEIVNGDERIEYDGYVPKFMPGEHYGDYVQLDIDTDTGLIINWESPGDDEILEQLGGPIGENA